MINSELTPQQQKLNVFLNKIGGLIYSHNNSIILDYTFFEFESGWYDLLISTIETLISMGWTKNIYQAKEKFGKLRIYIDINEPNYNNLTDVLANVEIKSSVICEFCGSHSAHMRKQRHWIRTLCDECDSKLN